MRLINCISIALIAGILLPINTTGKQHNNFPPPKYYVFDTTWRPRVFEYCTQVIGVPSKPRNVMAIHDLVNLNDCIDKIIKRNEHTCRNCRKNVEILFIDDTGQIN